MLTIIADANIAHLSDYFKQKTLGCPIDLIVMAGRDIDKAVLAKYQPDALLIRSVTPINSELLTNNASVKFVGSATIGTDHVDLDYLAGRNIKFANATGCSKHSVAQYVMSAILTVHPEYWHGTNDQSALTLGIIGLGNIGATLANYGTDLGWQVLGYDPLLPNAPFNNASFTEILSNSQMISLHTPLTMADTSRFPTYHMFDEAVFAALPKETMLINSSRGAVISEAALLTDLNDSPSGKKREVVLDVFEHEPNISADLLTKLTLATPHIAGYTLEGKLGGTQMIFDAFVDWLSQTLAVTDTEQDAPLMQRLLPTNPYYWHDLTNNPEKLATYYDIKADDRLLRQAIDKNTHKVAGSTFDALRKNYRLRREWLYD